MNIDQRLHRAVHDLREIDIAVPPFEAGTATRNGVSLRRLGAPVATVMLFALGALGAVSEMTPTGTAAGQMAISAAVADPVESPAPGERGRDANRQLPARQEVALISALAQQKSATAQETAIDSSIPSGAV